MVMIGADADALDAEAHQVQQVADKLRREAAQLTTKLNCAPWHGHGADRFRSSWMREHRKALIEAAAFLSRLAETLRRNARQQRKASIAGSGHFLGRGSSGPDGGAAWRRWTRQFDANNERAKKLGLQGVDGPPPRQILMIDGTKGDQRITEVYGDLSKAKKVIIHVPGMNTDLDDYRNGNPDAKALLAKAQEMYGPDVAVVSFLDYNVPDDLGEAASSAGADSGVAPLRQLVADLHAQGFRTNDLSVVAHSYGTVVAGHAMKQGLDVRTVVALGSPGMGADDRAGLGSPSVNLYAGSAPLNVIAGRQGGLTAAGTVVGGPGGGLIAAGDPVSWAPAHGESPTTPGFGSNKVDVPDAYGHSQYFRQQRSLHNIVECAYSS